MSKQCPFLIIKNLEKKPTFLASPSLTAELKTLQKCTVPIQLPKLTPNQKSAMRFSSGRQRNPTRPNRHHRRQAFPFLDQISNQGVRSPRSRRASSVSSMSLEEMTRICNELQASRNTQSPRPSPDLGMLGSDLDINMMDLHSPMPSEPASPTSSISPHSPIRRSSPSPSPSRVKEGDMIRITLKINATNVPCIAKCCPREQTSTVNEDFIRTWRVPHHPTPRMRLETRGSDSWCALDVVDVEKVGSTKVKLRMPISKFQDPRFNVVLGVEALNSLGLIGSSGPRSTPDPGHASVDNSLLLYPGWSRGFSPSSPTSPEPQRPSLTVSIPPVPAIRIDPPLLSLPGGSTSADDSGSNSDMFSMISYGDGAWSPAPSSEFDMERASQYDQ